MPTERGRQRAERAALLAVVSAALLLCSTGCGLSVAGHWRLAKAIPSREVFAIDDAHFARDGRFTATVTIEGRTAREKGTYEFNGFKLTLRPQAGGQRRYDAVERFGKLEVIDGERKVILKKARKAAKSEQGARK